jgi:hypothetical protein
MRRILAPLALLAIACCGGAISEPTEQTAKTVQGLTADHAYVWGDQHVDSSRYVTEVYGAVTVPPLVTGSLEGVRFPEISYWNAIIVGNRYVLQPVVEQGLWNGVPDENSYYMTAVVYDAYTGIQQQGQVVAVHQGDTVEMHVKLQSTDEAYGTTCSLGGCQRYISTPAQNDSWTISTFDDQTGGLSQYFITLPHAQSYAVLGEEEYRYVQYCDELSDAQWLPTWMLSSVFGDPNAYLPGDRPQFETVAPAFQTSIPKGAPACRYNEYAYNANGNTGVVLTNN